MSHWDRDKFDPIDEPSDVRARRLKQESKVKDAKYDVRIDGYVIFCSDCNGWRPFYIYSQEDLIHSGDDIAIACAICDGG